MSLHRTRSLPRMAHILRSIQRQAGGLHSYSWTASNSFSATATARWRPSSSHGIRAASVLSPTRCQGVDYEIHGGPSLESLESKSEAGVIRASRHRTLPPRRSFSSSSSPSPINDLREWGKDPENSKRYFFICVSGMAVWVLLEIMADTYSFFRVPEDPLMTWLNPVGALGWLVFPKQDVPIGNHMNVVDVVDLPSDDAGLQGVREVVERLSYAAGLEKEEWEIVVTNADDAISAEATGNHKVIVSTGLLKAANSDSEMAFPIGHSLAHFAADHDRTPVRDYIYYKAIRPIGRLYLTAASLAVAAALVLKQRRYAVLVTVLSLGLVNPNIVMQPAVPSRSYRQLNADEMSLLFLEMAGYNPAEAVGIVPLMARQPCSIQVDGEGGIVCDRRPERSEADSIRERIEKIEDALPSISERAKQAKDQTISVSNINWDPKTRKWRERRLHSIPHLA